MPLLHPLALAAALLLSHASLRAQGATASAPPRPASAASAASAAQGNLPLTLQANSLRGRPDLDVVAEGDVQLQRGRITIRSDRLTYDSVEDRARAQGNVQILTSEGDRFSGPELNLRLQRFEGYFLQPEYFFARTGAGGRAARIDFIDRDRAQLSQATYPSCTLQVGSWLPGGGVTPCHERWVTKASLSPSRTESNVAPSCIDPVGIRNGCK